MNEKKEMTGTKCELLMDFHLLQIHNCFSAIFFVFVLDFFAAAPRKSALYSDILCLCESVYQNR